MEKTLGWGDLASGLTVLLRVKGSRWAILKDRSGGSYSPEGILRGPVAPRWNLQEERWARAGPVGMLALGCICSLTTYLLPDLLSDSIQLTGQRVCLQGIFKLSLPERVAMETGEDVRLSLSWPSSPLSCPLLPILGPACF